jgi:hypothetical protein
LLYLRDPTNVSNLPSFNAATLTADIQRPFDSQFGIKFTHTTQTLPANLAMTGDCRSVVANRCSTSTCGSNATNRNCSDGTSELHHTNLIKLLNRVRSGAGNGTGFAINTSNHDLYAVLASSALCSKKTNAECSNKWGIANATGSRWTYNRHSSDFSPARRARILQHEISHNFYVQDDKNHACTTNAFCIMRDPNDPNFNIFDAPLNNVTYQNSIWCARHRAQFNRNLPIEP